MNPKDLIVDVLQAGAAVPELKTDQSAYAKLKNLLAGRFGRDKNDTGTVVLANFEKNTAIWAAPLKQCLQETDNDLVEIFAAVKELADILQGSDQGRQSLIKFQITGSQIGIIGDHAHVEGGLHFHTHQDDTLSRTTQSARQRYLNDLAAETNQLPWGRISREQAGPCQSESLRLADVYTALDTIEMEHMECEDEVRQCLSHHEKQQRISAQQILNEQSKLVLLGDPGSGKTTLVNYLTYVMACAANSDTPDRHLARLHKNGPWTHGALMPVRIILRDFSIWLEKGTEEQRDIVSWIRKKLADTGVEEFWPALHASLQQEDEKVLILFDGLDEVATSMRQKVVESIEHFSQQYKQNRFLVTCRIYAYVDLAFRLRSFRQTVLAPFSKEQIEYFIDAWYSELVTQKRIAADKAGILAGKLKTAIQQSNLGELAQRPLIMTVMALLHSSDGQLPDDRVELYQWSVELLFRRWQSATGQGEKNLMATLAMPQLKVSDLEAGLYHAAFLAHQGHGNGEGTADILEETLVKQLRPYLGNDWNKAQLFVDYIRERAGLLISHKPGAYTFPHRTFQEFMAACHLTGKKNYAGEAALLVRNNADLWRIVFVLAAGHAARNHQLGNAISSVNKLCPESVDEATEPDADAFTRALIAGEALAEVGLVGVEREEEGKVVLRRVRKWLVESLGADSVLAPTVRVKAGEVLARLGDPRPEVVSVDSMQFCLVPPGPFIKGAGDSARQDDSLEYGYWISRYPVTNAQYDMFVKAEEYIDERFWEDGKSMKRTRDFSDAEANHPVTSVSWYEAMAYCNWLTARWKKKFKHTLNVRLPDADEWEKAAKGGLQLPETLQPVAAEDIASSSLCAQKKVPNPRPDRIYPWGDDPDYNKANSIETCIGTTSSVGCFTGGVSPYGLMEISGNVWEWCKDQMGSRRIFRGGSWISGTGDCRVVRRGSLVPDNRSFNLGFRLVFLEQQNTNVSTG